MSNSAQENETSGNMMEPSAAIQQAVNAFESAKEKKLATAEIINNAAHAYNVQLGNGDITSIQYEQKLDELKKIENSGNLSRQVPISEEEIEALKAQNLPVPKSPYAKALEAKDDLDPIIRKTKFDNAMQRLREDPKRDNIPDLMMCVTYTTTQIANAEKKKDKDPKKFGEIIVEMTTRLTELENLPFDRDMKQRCTRELDKHWDKYKQNGAQLTQQAVPANQTTGISIKLQQ